MSSSSKEARLIRAKQMSGAAVSMALKPSRGTRDDIILAGGKPKDHSKENYRRLKEMELARKHAEQERSKPPPTPFRLKQFEDVPSKLSTRRSSPASSSPASSASSRPSSAGSGTSAPSSASKNFIRMNAEQARERQLRRSVSTPEGLQMRRSTPIGVLPKYLVERKLDWARQEKERELALAAQAIPPGKRKVSEEERRGALQHLITRQAELERELAQFSLVIESMRQRKKKADLEAQLQEVEDAIELYSRPVVYVLREEEGPGLALAAEP
ncbi:Enkurin domain-containing protein 1 [Phlyctochytrium bullatum]|nr:Enkurin domain-containing protein 1 [Phlyctochytrium bullatum]